MHGGVLEGHRQDHQGRVSRRVNQIGNLGSPAKRIAPEIWCQFRLLCPPPRYENGDGDKSKVKADADRGLKNSIHYVQWPDNSIGRNRSF